MKYDIVAKKKSVIQMKSSSIFFVYVLKKIGRGFGGRGTKDRHAFERHDCEEIEAKYI
jgi:hypothetical protein